MNETSTEEETFFTWFTGQKVPQTPHPCRQALINMLKYFSVSTRCLRILLWFCLLLYYSLNKHYTVLILKIGYSFCSSMQTDETMLWLSFLNLWQLVEVWRTCIHVNIVFSWYIASFSGLLVLLYIKLFLLL